jgi:hypothetical protein
MPYSPVEVNHQFGGTYCLHLQGRKRKQETSMKQAENNVLLTFQPWRWRRNTSPKCQLKKQYMAIHRVIAVRASEILFLGAPNVHHSVHKRPRWIPIKISGVRLVSNYIRGWKWSYHGNYYDKQAPDQTVLWPQSEWADARLLSRCHPESDGGQTTINLSQNSRCPCRDLNEAPPRHKSGVLPLHQSVKGKVVPVLN